MDFVLNRKVWKDFYIKGFGREENIE